MSKKCHICGDMHYISIYNIQNTEYYICDNCKWDGKIWHCHECGDYFFAQDLTFDANFSSPMRAFCDTCIEEKEIEKCFDCGSYFQKSDMEIIDGEFVCSMCAENCQIDIIHEASHQPEWKFYGNTNDRKFGVELEIEKKFSSEELDNSQVITANQTINENGDFTFFKVDSSLTNGYEIVSHPCSLEIHQNSILWQETMDLLIDQDFEIFPDTTGLHVHIDRNSFGSTIQEQELNIAKLLILFEVNIFKIIRFSGRVNQEKIKKYCKFYGISEDETNITLLEKAKKADRYYAVNIQNDDTIEIRIFSGMLDYNQFMASLEFCSLILDIVTKFSVQEITQLNWEKITEFGKDYEYFYSRAVNFL